MNPFEMVVLIVIITVGAGVARTWLKQRNLAPPPDPAKDQRLARLEERVSALEAIVTDHGYDLRKQFKDLERQA